MKSEKKCPACGQWTVWKKQLDDRCQHCDTLLQPHAIIEKEAREEREQKEAEHDFFRIRHDDGVGMKALRRTAWVGHVLYAAIVWFFLVMFASTPG